MQAAIPTDGQGQAHIKYRQGGQAKRRTERLPGWKTEGMQTDRRIDKNRDRRIERPQK